MNAKRCERGVGKSNLGPSSTQDLSTSGIRRHRSEISWARRFKSVPFNQYGGQRSNKLASNTEQITRKQRHSATSDAIS